MTNIQIEERLLTLSSPDHKKFATTLTPTKDKILGIKIPQLRNLAKDILQSPDFCLQEYFDNFNTDIFESKMLLGFLIGYSKLTLFEKFNYLFKFTKLIDNWSVCDSVAMTIKFKASEMENARNLLCPMLNSQDEFPRRFGIVLLFTNFLKEDYAESTIEYLTNSPSTLFYIQNAVAWGLCDCIIKHPQLAIPKFATSALDKYTYNRTISKCCDPFSVKKKKKD